MKHSDTDSELPLVLQVGFSGSRSFLPPDRAARVNQSDFEQVIETYLVNHLSQLPAELGLPKRRFICGICQLAAGGDTLFVQACRRIGAPVRLFLPQPPDVFFSAGGAEADFTPQQRAAGEAIIASPDIAQIRVIGEATGRSARFQAVNHEVARVSDVSICLVRSNAEFNQGGTLEFLAQARVRRRPVLKITVSEEEGRPVFTDEWIDKDQFVAPQPPHSLSHITSAKPPLDEIPKIDSYVARLREDCHDGANRFRDRFNRFANIIIGTHIFATMLALLALALHDYRSILPPLLAIELACLGIGFGAHWLMHALHLTKKWAEHRLVLQLASSVEAVNGIQAPLDFLFHLPMPQGFRSLLRTLNVMHLRDARDAVTREPINWEIRRNRYIKARVDNQRAYYERKMKFDRTKLRFFHYAFTCFSALAILATGAKLAIKLWERSSKTTASSHDEAPSRHGLSNSTPIVAVALRGPTVQDASKPHTTDQTSNEHSAEIQNQSETPHEKGGQADKSHGANDHAKHDPTLDFVANRLGELAVLFPVLAVAMMSIAAAHDLEGRLHTYDEMVEFLTSQTDALNAASSSNDFDRLALETEARLLGETVNWLSRRSFTGVA